MDQIGYVVKLEKDKAVVDVRRVSACGDKCSSCGGECSVQGVRVKIKNTLMVKPGDYVEINSETKTVMKAAFIAYVIPLIFLFIGTALGSVGFKRIGIEDNELYSFFVGMVFLGLSYLIVRKVDNNISKKGVEQFTMVNVL